MENPVLLEAIRRLAAAGERAGFTVDEMIHLLKAGVSIETLLGMIETRLDDGTRNPATAEQSTRWIM